MTEPALAGPVLLIGAGGMLGRAWERLLAGQGVQAQAPPRRELDLTNAAAVQRWLRRNWQLVINCAAWTDVDGAEQNPEQARLVNGHAVGLMAQACRETGALLVHYSTDYVFNGLARQPYPVQHPVDPINEYGHSKVLGERLVLQSGCRHLILRASWLYAPWGRNFVRTMIRLMNQQHTVRVVEDQRGRPTSAEHLAEASLALIRHGACGILHVTDGGECSWFQFAAHIAHLRGWSGSVQPCATSQFPRPARRPAYSVLDLSHTERLIGPMPPWTSRLPGILTRVEPEPS